MFLILALLVLLPISYEFEAKYPGLIKASARCPESSSDNDWWYLAETYSKIPVCFGRRDLPANLNSFKDVEAACREKHEDSFPARLYTDQNVAFLLRRGMASNAVFGAYLKNNLTIEETEVYGINSSDQYAVYLHGNRVYATNISTFSANPRELNLNHDGWDLQAPCNGTPFCYKQITQYKAPYDLQPLLTQINVCGMEEPNSFPASIHCQDEYGYIQFKYRGMTRMGLYLPHRGPWNKFDTWQNIDGTPADFVPWAPYEPNNCDNLYEKTVHIDSPSNFNDVNAVINLRHTLCKKPAVKKQVPLDVKRYDTFEVNGNECGKEPVTHWNHQCPTNSSLWQIVQSEAGVHCYALVNAPAPLSNNNFTHELCHDLHPGAKLASFHYGLQFGFLYPLNDDANKVVVGMIPNNNTFAWADGTPMNKSFWAPSEPPSNTSGLVVRIQNTVQIMSLTCKTRLKRPLFKTMKIEDVEADMKVACKIEAEPLLPCAPVPDADGMESLNNTVCPEGWTKQRFCDKVHCYKRVLVANGYQTFVQAIENDYCHTLDPESHLASIHCVEEHFFVQGYPAQTLIGLHIPTKFHNDTFNVKNFEWTDGTPVDFVGWNRFSNPEIDSQYAPLFPSDISDNIKFSQVYNKNDDGKSGWSNQYGGYHHVLCKKKATVISHA